MARKVRVLLERYRRGRWARVTLGGGTTEVEAIHAHLRGEIGFHEVGYAPVTAAAEAGHGSSDAELFKEASRLRAVGDYWRAALRGENNGFFEHALLMTDLHEGRRKSPFAVRGGAVKGGRATQLNCAIASRVRICPPSAM